MNTERITYCFELPDHSKEYFELVINMESLEAVMSQQEASPIWTELHFHRCPNCLLPDDKHWCPMAKNLATIVEKFENVLSHEQVRLAVKTKERSVFQKTTAQQGIASLMGLVMATSGCPHTSFLKPMARFHLPLSSQAETIYRAFSMYALAQCIVNKDAEHIDNNFAGLKQLYHNMEVVNFSFVKRLKAASPSDSSINALINLDMYAKAMPYVIEDSLEELRYLFKPYLQELKKQVND